MKRRKKNAEISPLQSYQVGKIKENKFGFIKLIICVAFFGAVIFYLPELNNIYQKYVKGFLAGGVAGGSSDTSGNNSNTNNVNNNTTNNTVEDNTTNEETKYSFADAKSVEVKNLKFSAIRYSQNKVMFDVTNLLSTTAVLDSSNVYFEAYDKNNNLIKRYAMVGNIAGSKSKGYAFDIKSEPSYYEIKEILEDDYTYIDLKIDDNNVSKLNCTKNNEKLVYTFNNEKLVKIDHVDEVGKDDADYDDKYTEYNSVYVKYRSSLGITTSFNVEDDSLYYKMIIDYEKDDKVKVDNRIYFAKDTSPRIVNFKLESWEYECS